MEEVKNGQLNNPNQVWMCLKGKALPTKEPEEKQQREDLRAKVEENESFTDQMEVMMQYLQASIKASNQNSLILHKVLENQKKFAEEKVLAQYFAKLNKILDSERGSRNTKIQRTSQKLDKMNSNLISKKGTFEDLEGLGFVLDVNSELWKGMTCQIEESRGLKERIKNVEREERKLKDKVRQEEGFRKKFVKDLEQVRKAEKEGQSKVLEECLQELEKTQQIMGDKIGNLGSKVDGLRENYNWRIEDLNTKLENRVDLQQLETTVETINTALSNQNRKVFTDSQSCLFSKESTKVFENPNNPRWSPIDPQNLLTLLYQKDSFSKMPKLRLWKIKSGVWCLLKTSWEWRADWRRN